MDPMDRALYCAVEEGWHVFPVRLEPDPVNPGKMLKMPLIRWGTEASVSELAIEAMPWGRANAVGVACGPSGLCVIDVDPGATEETLRRVAKLPKTWEQRTPRGRHLVYRAPRAFRQGNTTGSPYPGIDIRGDGGYIVLYAELDEMPTPGEAIAPWPLKAPVGRPQRVEQTASPLDQIGQLPQPGERNQWLARTAGKLIHLGFTRADVATLLLPLADQLGISERECRATFLKSAADWEQARQAEQAEVRAQATTGKTLQQLLEEPDDAEPHALPDLLPYGMTILAGAPKVGKSWLALQIAHALATGTPVLGATPERTGPVGYYAVEESWPQLRHRVRQLPDPKDGDIEFYLQMPSGREGVEYLMESRHTFMVLDTGVRALGAPSEYAEIQKLYGPLQSWAKREQRVLKVLWHTTKTLFDANSGRPIDRGMDAIMGSRGLVAVADAMWLLVYGGMAVEGRDIPKSTLILRRDGDTPWLTQEGSDGIQAQLVDLLRRQGGTP